MVAKVFDAPAHLIAIGIIFGDDSELVLAIEVGNEITAFHVALQKLVEADRKMVFDNLSKAKLVGDHLLAEKYCSCHLLRHGCRPDTFYGMDAASKMRAGILLGLTGLR